MKQITYYLILIILLTGCSIGNEVVMPFRNFEYSGERLFPLEKNNSKIAFRAWVNNGTSIDRVISVYFDSSFSSFGYQAKLTEFGSLTKKGILKSKDEYFYNEREIIPKSEFDHFFKTIDSLGLINYSSQDLFNYGFSHQPFSLYVIEIKNGNKYNQFQFRTHFPNRAKKVNDKYELIENLIFDEFTYDFYLN
jgi:hypothetical protein